MTNQEQDMSDFSMLDLFRMEVEAQSTNFNENLLALEADPENSPALEALMRAAHSLKGAARIVQLDVAVTIAHVMEDCFVAAKAGKITLTPDCIDVLLQGVDLIDRISQVKEPDMDNWLAEYGSEINRQRQAIAAILTSKSSEGTRQCLAPTEELQATQKASQSETTTESPDLDRPPAIDQQTSGSPTSSPAPQITPESDKSEATDRSDRVVRVIAENLNRLMGLAGESLVEANWLEPFADSLLSLKKQQLELAKSLDKLEESLLDRSSNSLSYDCLESAKQLQQQCRQILTDRINELDRFSRRFTNLSERLYQSVIASKMHPFAEVSIGFPRLIRDLARKLGRQVKFEIIGKSTQVDRDILEKIEAPLTHVLQNAIFHGIESPEERLAAGKTAEGLVRLEVTHRGGMLSITVSDDGRGIELEYLRQIIGEKNLINREMANQLTEHELMEFLFLPGFSTADRVSEISGRGVGLDLAKTMVQEVGGLLQAVDRPGQGMTFHFQLPLTLSVVRTLLVEISGEAYAFPMTRIDQIVKLNYAEILRVENHQYFTLDDENISLVPAYQVLELKETPLDLDALPVVIVSDRVNRYGLAVDRFIGDRDLVVRPLDPRLGKVRDLSAAAFREDGSPVLILDVEDLVRSIDKILASGQLNLIEATQDSAEEKRTKRVLVVDDSIAVRQMERKILENNGYQVEVAVDGMDAWNAVRTAEYDLVITDVDMPRMNGIELVDKIKTHPKLKSIPTVIVSYKDRESDRLRGLEVGANYYLTKSSFHDDTFLQAAIDTIGEAV